MLHEKEFCVKKKKLDVAQKVICCRQKQVDVARKIVLRQPKKVDVARKNVSCRQKQDGAAQKNYLVFKEVIIVSETVRHNYVYIFFIVWIFVQAM